MGKSVKNDQEKPLHTYYDRVRFVVISLGSHNINSNSSYNFRIYFIVYEITCTVIN